MNKQIVKAIVRNNDGTINAEATQEAYVAALLDNFSKSMVETEIKLKKEYDTAIASFATDLTVYESERGVWDLRSKEYIDKVFEKYGASAKGGAITKPTLVNLCVTSMVQDGLVEFAQMKHVSEMVTSFIDDNDGLLYTVQRGRDGGVRRISRHPDAEIA